MIQVRTSAEFSDDHADHRRGTEAQTSRIRAWGETSWKISRTQTLSQTYIRKSKSRTSSAINASSLIAHSTAGARSQLDHHQRGTVKGMNQGVPGRSGYRDKVMLSKLPDRALLRPQQGK